MAAMFLLAVQVPSMLRAQVGAADVLGTVTDQSGAAIANARVTVKNQGTSSERMTSTNASGEYVISALPIGRYSLTVEAQGFKSSVIASLPLSTGDRARYDVQLHTGVVTETVKVTGEAAALQTDTSEVTNTIDNNLVQEMPLNNRQFVTALRIQAGVSAGSQGGASTGSNGSQYDRRPDSTVVANGQSSSLNNYLIDGFDNNERQQGFIGLQPSIDGIQEVKMDTSGYRAEYGRTAGAVINVVTKSGTNDFHGSAYDYLRNDVLNADSYNFVPGTTIIKPEYRQNNFGGSLGGPIRKNKSFFFFDIEEDRIVKGQVINTFVPTAFERQNPGNLTDAGGPNLIDCTDASGNSLVGSNPFISSTAECALNPIMLEYFNLFPASQADKNGLGYRTDSPKETQFGRTLDLRVDHHFSTNDVLFARYASNPVSSVLPDAWPIIKSGPYAGISPGGTGGTVFPGPSTTSSQNLQLNYVHIFTPALLADLKAGYTRVNIQSYPWNYGIGAASKLNLPGVYSSGLPQTDGLPGIGGPGVTWSFEGSSLNVPDSDIDNTFQYSGALSYTLKTNSLKFGGGTNRRQLAPFSNNCLAGFLIMANSPPFFNGAADYLTGYPIGELRGNQLDHPGFRSWELFGYAQDDWRFSRKLTLNLGLRYDVFTPFTEAHGQYANYIPSSETMVLGTQKASVGVATDYHDLAPRFGFAYSITPKTVFHGGFGISFYPPDVGIVTGGGGGAAISIVQNLNPPFAFEYANVGPQFTGFFSQPVTGFVPVQSLSAQMQSVSSGAWKQDPTITALASKAPGLSSAYAELFNVALQREIGLNTISLGYVGVMGHQLLRTVNMDNPGPSGANQPTLPYVYAQDLPYINEITYSYNGAASNYSAMQATYSRSLTKGFTISANYTWAHGLDDEAAGGQATGSEGTLVPSSPHYDYGNSVNDIRQRVAVVGAYDLPFAKNSHGIEGILLKDWQATSIFYWQTGLPFTVVSRATAPNGLAYINEPGVATDYPDVVGKVSLSHPGIDGWFNVNAFLPQTLGTVSNQRVNQFRGPRDRRDDLAITKIFPLNERFKVQFRAECFNLSNTPNFATPNNFLPAWKYQTARDNSTPVIGVDTTGSNFGEITDTAANENPRQFQFALKLQF